MPVKHAPLLTAAALLALLLFPVPAKAATVAEYIAEKHPGLNADAAVILAPLGVMATMEKAFVDRLALLPQERQKEFAFKLAIDGRITPDDLAALPVMIPLPGEPTEILSMLAERVRSDYWPGFYRRHRFAVHMQLRDWRDTAERRYDDPEFAKRLIDIFFLMVEGQYDGPMVLEYHPEKRDAHKAAD